MPFSPTLIRHVSLLSRDFLAKLEARQILTITNGECCHRGCCPSGRDLMSDDYFPHEDGVVLLRGGKYFLNGLKEIKTHEFAQEFKHPALTDKDVVKEFTWSFAGIMFYDKVLSWKFHPAGFVVRRKPDTVCDLVTIKV